MRFSTETAVLWLSACGVDLAAELFAAMQDPTVATFGRLAARAIAVVVAVQILLEARHAASDR